MKAERRHELRTNTLAQFLSDLPLYLRFHANKILFGIIVICLIILLVRYRMNATAAAREATRASIVSARMGVEQLKFIDNSQPNDTARAQERRKLATSVNTAIDQILEATEDPDDAAIRAEALITRGDLNWALANLPDLPGAATQPALAQPQTDEQYLENAASAYQQVLNSYPEQHVSRATALLGLAAIEENRGGWDRAVEFYNRLVTDERIAQAFKEIARQRLAVIPQLRTPVYLGSFSSTQPSTAPTTSAAPSTAPTTKSEAGGPG